ncbi:MAG: S8 family serine peptidase, partial [Pirellulales bacterium]
MATQLVDSERHFRSQMRQDLQAIVYRHWQQRRYTQDSPVYADVWFECLQRRLAGRPNERMDLLLVPHRQSNATELHEWIFRRLNCARERRRRAETREADVGGPFGLAYSESQVVVRLSLGEMLRVALPLTQWWRRYVWQDETLTGSIVRGEPATKVRLTDDDECKRLGDYLDRLRRGLPIERSPSAQEADWNDDLIWLVYVTGWLSTVKPAPSPVRRRVAPQAASGYEFVKGCYELIDGYSYLPVPEHAVLWSIFLNREGRTAQNKSVPAIKADAAKTLFHLNCSQLNWAVIDSGVDATHPAFRLAGTETAFDDNHGTVVNNTRVRATYDFTRLRQLMAGRSDKLLKASVRPAPRRGRGQQRLRVEPADLEREREFFEQLSDGVMLNWDAIGPQLEVPHRLALAGEQGTTRYEIPQHPHGTHVAGILAGDWKEASLEGVCPDMRLYDLRVFDGTGAGDEYSISAALQFVRHLNSGTDRIVIQGVNLSLSIRHEVDKFACGQTPVCLECDRLVATGVVVVAAAGNEGCHEFVVLGPENEYSVARGYLGSGITDPGNAERVITVGATYREHPHTYGVSYFSSRGPTGDGRSKPDLLAPGEKITAPVPGGRSDTFDGTSMAAPHVSG